MEEDVRYLPKALKEEEETVRGGKKEARCSFLNVAALVQL
jgi:hypothetical protein